MRRRRDDPDEDKTGLRISIFEGVKSFPKYFPFQNPSFGKDFVFGEIIPERGKSFPSRLGKISDRKE